MSPALNRITGVRPLLITALIAIALITASFCLQEHIGINLGDEGFLWYGVQRVLHGEIPGRDFHAYEPGRYLWDAAFAVILRSDGLLQLRIANSAFAAVGLFFGLLAARTIVRSWFLLTLFGAILTLWLFPRHKLFEHSIAMIGVFVATDLIRNPTLRRHALAGAVVGIAMFFGRNHGVYLGLSLSCTAIYVYLRVDRQRALRRAAAFIGGFVLGLLPLFSMFLFVRGFWHSFVESIVAMTQGANQQSLPIPWPWLVRASSLPLAPAAYDIGTGVGFLLMPALFGSVLLWSILMRRSTIQNRSLVIASAFVGITYTHHAFSRADFAHLAQAIHPMLLCVIGIVGLAIQNHKRILAAGVTAFLLGFTAVTAMYASPFADFHRTPASQRAGMRIDGHTFLVTTFQKQLLSNLKLEVAAHVGAGQSFAAAPLFPFAYAYMYARSPWWDIYHLFARDAAWQQHMIDEMTDRHVTLIMLSTDVAVDGRDELRFPNSNPLVWQYIQSHYTPEDLPGGGVRFWHRKEIP